MSPAANSRWVWVAVFSGVWRLDRVAFRTLCAARAVGRTEGDGDLDRVGTPLKEPLSYGEKAQLARGGFPSTTDGKPRFNVTDGTRSQWAEAAAALSDGTFEEWRKGRCP